MFKNIRKHLKNEKGLTLVELLAVIVILGIIGAIAVPSIGGVIQKSHEDAVKSDAIQVINAVKLFVVADGMPDAADETNGTNEITIDGGDITIKASSPKLKPYLDITNAETEKFTVTINSSADAITYTISSPVPIKAGNATITFTDATIAGINKDDGKGTRSIGPNGTIPKAG